MKGIKCVKCGKEAKPAKLRFQGHEIGGWKCSCGEEYFDPAQAERILLLNKLKKQEFQLKLGRIRSNLIIRIPKAVEEALDLSKDEMVALSISGSKTIKIKA